MTAMSPGSSSAMPSAADLPAGLSAPPWRQRSSWPQADGCRATTAPLSRWGRCNGSPWHCCRWLALSWRWLPPDIRCFALSGGFSSPWGHALSARLPMRLVLLDRDGVLNADREDSVKTPAELVMLPGAAEAVARLNNAGRLVALVSNQSVVGRGIIDAAMLARIQEKLTGELAGAGAKLDAVFYCPDAPHAAGP